MFLDFLPSADNQIELKNGGNAGKISLFPTHFYIARAYGRSRSVSSGNTVFSKGSERLCCCLPRAKIDWKRSDSLASTRITKPRDCLLRGARAEGRDRKVKIRFQKYSAGKSPRQFSAGESPRQFSAVFGQRRWPSHWTLISPLDLFFDWTPA